MTFLEFMRQNWYDILMALITLGSIIAIIVSRLKSGNVKGVKDLFKVLPSLIDEAEKLFGRGNGAKKLNYVLTQIKLIALEKNIKVNMTEFENQVNEIVTAKNTTDTERTPTITNDNDNNSNAVVKIIENDNINI